MESKKTDEKKNMLREALVLFVITLVSGLLLGFVYEITKKPIEKQEKKAMEKACTTVFPTATSFTTKEYAPSGEIKLKLEENKVTLDKVMEAKNQAQELLGYVAEVTSKEGYGGNITLYVGITKDGIINGVSILKISETQGLGMKAEEVLVPQFANKDVKEFVYTKTGSTKPEEIDAISGATVTTKAVTKAVNMALYVVHTEWIEKE